MSELLVEQLRAAGKARLPASGLLPSGEAPPLELVAAEELERLSAECLEQARCNGMGAERELAMQARIARLEQALKLTVYALQEARLHCSALNSDFDPPEAQSNQDQTSGFHVWQSLVPNALAKANLALSPAAIQEKPSKS